MQDVAVLIMLAPTPPTGGREAITPSSLPMAPLIRSAAVCDQRLERMDRSFFSVGGVFLLSGEAARTFGRRIIITDCGHGGGEGGGGSLSIWLSVCLPIHPSAHSLVYRLILLAF